VTFTYVTVQATYETAEDVAAQGRVEFTPIDQMRNGLSIVAAPVEDTLDPAGSISIRLAATTDPGTRPTGVTYRVVERIVGQPLRVYYKAVPHDQGATLQLADLPDVVANTAGGFALRNALDYDNSLPPQDGQVMTWDGGTQKFRPEPPTGGVGPGGGVSSVNGQTGNVTITATGLGAQPIDTDLTAFAALNPPAGSFLQRQGSTWDTRSPAQLKSDLALDQVDNTADANKPISNAVSAALAGKAAATHTHPIGQITATGTPTSSTFLRGDGAWASIPTGTGGGTPVGLVSQTVAYSSSVTLDAGTADIFTITLTGNVALAGVVGADDCQPIFLNLFASSADRTLSLGGGASAVTIPAGTWWLGTFRYRAPADLLHLVEEYVTPGTPPGGGGGGPVAATVDTGRVDTDTITA
jgi:hypothetical protein